MTNTPTPAERAAADELVRERTADERIDRYARALYTADHPRGTWERRPPEDHEAYRVRARAAITQADTEMEQLHADRTQAITDLDRARAAARRILTCGARWSRRAETAEAAISRARHLADLIDAGAPWLASHHETATRIRTALAPAPANAPARAAVRPPGGLGGGVAAWESPEGENGAQAGAHGLQGAEGRRRAAQAMNRLWRDTNGDATFDQLAAAALAAAADTEKENRR